MTWSYKLSFDIRKTDISTRFLPPFRSGCKSGIFLDLFQGKTRHSRNQRRPESDKYCHINQNS